MAISDDDIQQIRNRVNLVDVIAENLPLKKSGRTWRGLCPFHNENTPSFHVDPAKQLYHCFGCGAGGDVFTYLMKTEGLEFRESIETLARKIGYTLTTTTSAQSGMKSRLLMVCEEASLFYSQELAGNNGARARSYLAKRNLTALTADYRLGLSPDWSSVIDFLKGRAFTEAEIIKSGVAGHSDRGTVYDRFKGRLIFPIMDSQGRPIAFGGRVLDDSSPKYLNSPETPLYHKGSVLYGLAQAKNHCIKQDAAIVVEGYTDLLSLAGAGIRNVVATLGTAFTLDHFKLLSRFSARIILVFDGDEAGLNAAERSFEFIDHQRLPGHEVLAGLVDKVDLEMAVAVLPTGLDPADFVNKRGTDDFLALVASAKPLLSFLIDRIIARHHEKDAGSMISANEAAKLIRKLPSPVAQEEYMRYLADRLDIPYDTLTLEITRTKNAGPTSAAPRKTAPPSAEREFLKLVLQAPEKAAALNDVGVEYWLEPQLRQLGTVLKSQAAGKPDSALDILHKVDPELRDIVSELLLEPVPDVNAEDYFGEIFLKLKELAVERQIIILRKYLNKTGSKDKKYDELFAKLMSLEYKRRELKNQTVNGGSLWVKN
ncbi:MAG: DNA primase [Actinomycetota bacterium]|nr:DNA primase [Actinomycetota bacterium]